MKCFLPWLLCPQAVKPVSESPVSYSENIHESIKNTKTSNQAASSREFIHHLTSDFSYLAMISLPQTNWLLFLLIKGSQPSHAMHQILRLAFPSCLQFGNMKEKKDQRNDVWICAKPAAFEHQCEMFSVLFFPSVPKWQPAWLTCNQNNSSLGKHEAKQQRYPASAHVLSVRYDALSFHSVSLIYFRKTEYKCQSALLAALCRCTTQPPNPSFISRLSIPRNWSWLLFPRKCMCGMFAVCTGPL